MEVKYPVALTGDRMVWADECSAAGTRPSDLTCLGCDQPLSLRAGQHRRPHFAHRSGAACSGGEGALHRAAVLTVAEAIEKQRDAGVPWPVEWHCMGCGSARKGNPARHRGAVTIDKAINPRLRPDVVVRDESGTPRFAIEVVVTHPPDQPALDEYAALGLATAWVRPTWESLGDLRSGLTLAASDPTAEKVLHDEGAQAHTVTGAGACRNPRHPPAALPPPCMTCAAPTTWFVTETALGGECWSCHRQVRVCDITKLLPASGPQPLGERTWETQSWAASARSLGDVASLVAQQGAEARKASSKTLGGISYLMHHCHRCHRKQGDNFMYGGGALDTSVPAAWWTQCPEHHWTLIEQRPWPVGSSVERRDEEVLGMWGSLDEAPNGGATVTSGVTVKQAISKMMGGGW